jgi:hypothetical protein
MTLIKKIISYFRLHEDINNKDIIVIKTKKTFYFYLTSTLPMMAAEGKKILSDLNLILLKINFRLKSFNLIITGDFNYNLDSL